MLMPSLIGESLLDDLMDDTFNRSARREYTRGISSMMNTDVKETGTGYDLEIEVPGISKENVKVELKDGYLTIQAVSKNDDSDSDSKYIRRERFVGTCTRSFFVGKDVKQSDIKAKFENGVLKISVPKKDAKPAAEESHYIDIEG